MGSLSSCHCSLRPPLLPRCRDAGWHGRQHTPRGAGRRGAAAGSSPAAEAEASESSPAPFPGRSLPASRAEAAGCCRSEPLVRLSAGGEAPAPLRLPCRRARAEGRIPRRSYGMLLIRAAGPPWSPTVWPVMPSSRVLHFTGESVDRVGSESLCPCLNQSDAYRGSRDAGSVCASPTCNRSSMAAFCAACFQGSTQQAVSSSPTSTILSSHAMQ